MTMSQARRERFNRARHQATVLDPAQLEMDAYNAGIDLAISNEWARLAYDSGKEIVRHASRMALAQHIAPELWADCTNCPPAPRACLVCGGTQSRLVNEGALAELIGIPHHTFVVIWRPRIDAISRVIGTWYDQRIEISASTDVQGL